MTHNVDIRPFHALAWNRPRPAAGVRSAPAPIEPGVVLVKRATALPEGVYIAGRRWGWNALAARSLEFADRIRGSEWQWSHYVPTVTASGRGFTTDRALAAAMRRVLRQTEATGMNSLEIVDVQVSERFGLKRAEVKAEVRNLQRGPFLRPLDPHHRYRAIHKRELMR